MLYILSGEDEFSISRALDTIKKGIGDPSALAVNTTTLDGRQLTLDQLRPICETFPFLSERRLVIVNGLLERFEAGSKKGRKKKASNIPDRQNEYQALADYMSNLPESTAVVLVDGRVKSGNPLFKALSTKAEVRRFPLLKGDELRQWIRGRVSEEGGRISPRAIESLARLVGGNLWAMSGEINKLVLFAIGRCIEEGDVMEVVSYAQEASVFTMVDAILEFKAGVAQRLLEELLRRGAAPPYLLVMLTRQVRMVILAREMKRRGENGSEIQRRLGLKGDYALRKTLEQAGSYSRQRLKEIYQQLLDTDLSIKTGKYDGELALNILVAELCQRRRGAGEFIARP